MTLKNALYAGFVALAGLAGGCSQEYPQYTASMKLAEAPTYSDESFKGEKCWPESLDVKHRMELKSGMWKSMLQIKFDGEDRPEGCPTPEGTFLVPLHEIAYKNDSAYPNDSPDGKMITVGPEKYGMGAFCHGHVEYYLSLVATPDYETWKKVYKTHGEWVGIDRGTGMDIYTALFDGAEAGIDEKAKEKWDRELDEHGMAFTLKITRHINSTTSGCIGGVLPGLGGGATTVAKYKADEIDQSTDIRKASTDLESTIRLHDLIFSLISK